MFLLQNDVPIFLFLIFVMLKYNFVTRFSLLFKRFNCIASCVQLLKCINVRNNEANICTISVLFCVDGHLPSIMIWSCCWTCNHINMVLGNNLNKECIIFQDMWIDIEKQFLMGIKFCHCNFHLRVSFGILT